MTTKTGYIEISTYRHGTHDYTRVNAWTIDSADIANLEYHGPCKHAPTAQMHCVNFLVALGCNDIQTNDLR